VTMDVTVTVTMDVTVTVTMDVTVTVAMDVTVTVTMDVTVTVTMDVTVTVTLQRRYAMQRGPDGITSIGQASGPTPLTAPAGKCFLNKILISVYSIRGILIAMVHRLFACDAPQNQNTDFLLV
jgi:hypothetical protein